MILHGDLWYSILGMTGLVVILMVLEACVILAKAGWARLRQKRPE